MTTRKTPRRATSYMATRRGSALPDADDPLLQFAPVPHVAPRRNSITAPRQRAFIAHLAATGIVAEAARAIGASLEALYKLRHRPGAEAFAAAWDQAVDRGVQRLEDGALARAIAGEERLVVSAGKVLGSEVRHNEALVMFFLKHRRADRYAPAPGPGHPLYERIRAQVLAELAAREQEDEEAILASLNAKIDLMREREAEVQRMLEEDLSSGEDPSGPSLLGADPSGPGQARDCGAPAGGRSALPDPGVSGTPGGLQTDTD